MADRIVVMHDGRIEQIGAPLELYDHPDNLFVAQFIGSPAMNVVNGTVRAQRTARRIVEVAGGVRWPLQQGPGAEGQAVAYGIRPGDLRSRARRAGRGARRNRRRRADGRRDRAADPGRRRAADPGHARPAQRESRRPRSASPIDPAKVHVFDQGNRRRDSASVTPASATRSLQLSHDRPMSKKSARRSARCAPHVVRQPRPRRDRPPLVDEEPGHSARPVRRPAGDRHLQHVVAGDAVQRALPRARAARARRRARRRRLSRSSFR